ncbi:MAG: NAD(P)-dependent oxidoreductase [Casimicrobium sp.]|jgi:uronate dehydrogenase
MPNKINRLLLTGAAGGLGRVLRPRLAALTNTLRVSDVANLGDAAPNEELMPCDLGDLDAMLALLEGVDAVVHLGGVSTDGAFEPILNANIRGVYNLYEAARISGTKRLLFASSNHAVGFHKQTERLDADALPRPDGNYGISKVFGEATAQYYFDRFGIETVSVRIGSSFPKPKDRRMMSTWLSYDDLTSLVTCALHAPHVGHTIVYGASDNKLTWWDNSKAAHLGWTPKDSSEPFRAEMEATAVHLAADDLAMQYQGGGFVKLGPFPSK